MSLCFMLREDMRLLLQCVIGEIINENISLFTRKPQSAPFKHKINMH